MNVFKTLTFAVLALPIALSAQTSCPAPWTVAQIGQSMNGTIAIEAAQISSETWEASAFTRFIVRLQLQQEFSFLTACVPLNDFPPAASCATDTPAAFALAVDNVLAETGWRYLELAKQPGNNPTTFNLEQAAGLKLDGLISELTPCSPLPHNP